MLKNAKNGALKARKGQFTEENIKGFKYLLLKESWQQVLLNSELKTIFKGCMDRVYFYIDMAIPLRSLYVRETNTKGGLHKD